MEVELDGWVASVLMVTIAGIITFYALAVVCDEYLIPVSSFPTHGHGFILGQTMRYF